MAALAAADMLIFDETMKCVGVAGFMAKGITYLPQITHLFSLGWYNSVTYEIKSRNRDFLFLYLLASCRIGNDCQALIAT